MLYTPGTCTILSPRFIVSISVSPIAAVSIQSVVYFESVCCILQVHILYLPLGSLYLSVCCVP